MLWSAIAWLQREHPDVIVLVYSGDYPAASKAEILAKVKVSLEPDHSVMPVTNVQDRFSIKLSPATLEFIPLASRHLISDTYWRRFTLLGQSAGSLWLAWEGLCGREGLWGDIFIGRIPLAGLLSDMLRLDGLRIHDALCASHRRG